MKHISLMSAQLETNDINIFSISLSHILNDITLLHDPCQYSTCKLNILDT